MIVAASTMPDPISARAAGMAVEAESVWCGPVRPRWSGSSVPGIPPAYGRAPDARRHPGLFRVGRYASTATLVAAGLPACTSILRGLAFSLTGMTTLSTPFSYDAEMLAVSMPSPRLS